MGLFVGLAERKKRLLGFRIAHENELFLLDQGFTETGGKDVTPRDGDGTTLTIAADNVASIAKAGGYRAVHQSLRLTDLPMI